MTQPGRAGLGCCPCRRGPAKARAGNLQELALFNKSIHLAEAMEAIEPGGFVEESRKGERG